MRPLSPLCLAILSPFLFALPPVTAQTPPDHAAARGYAVLPRDHFSYDAILKFSRAGMLDGMPKDADPFQGRTTVTRFEMASLVSRLLTYLESTATAAKADPTHTVTIPKEELELAGKLYREFDAELRLIGFDREKLRGLLPDIAALADRPHTAKEITEAQARLNQALIDPGKSGNEEDVLLTRLKNRITGYFQFRLDAILGNQDLFTSAGAGGSGQRPSTSGPAVGGPNTGLQVRRGRIKISDRISQKDEYVFQLDLPTSAAPNIRDAFVRVIDFPARNFALRAGQYAFNYGHEYVYSSRYRETPERAIGFSDSSQASFIFKRSVSSTGGVVTPGSVLPFFFDQDRDIGVELSWASPAKTGFIPRASVNIIQGEGRDIEGQRSLNGVYDLVATFEALNILGKDKVYGGLAYYNGWLSVRSAPPVDGVTQPFTNASRAFGGIYLRYVTQRGQEYRAEFSGGRYDVTPDRALYLPKNTFNAWYLVTRQLVAEKTEVYLKYDEFNPVKGSTVVAGVKGSDLARKTLSLGALYQYTAATRFHLNYSQGLTPYDVSAPSGSDLRSKLGVLQAEIQVTF